MFKCPNCNQSITEKEDICPNCNFNFKKYREDFFIKDQQSQQPKSSDDKKEDKSQTTSRIAYRRELHSEKSNSIVQKMIDWIRFNATIVFLLGIFLLIIMSFSRPLGWLIFFALLICLFIVCDRAQKVQRYTSDQRLTEKVNQLGLNLFNSVESHSQKIRSRSRKFGKNHPEVENQVTKVKIKESRRFGYIKLSVILTAFISLIVLFSGSGASVANDIYNQEMSISKVLLSFGGRLLSSGQTVVYALVVYLAWLLLILFPVFIIYNVLKNTKASQIIAFLLSLIETIFLIYILFKMISMPQSKSGIINQLTSQLLTYAVSVGVSSYFLILASVMTTALSGYDLFRVRKDKKVGRKDK